ncbi:TIGR02680 family protein [Bacillus sp. FJAT-49705]|uniref:TIGR02680 family protein n=1 Tax=Cytobacillus citreus TaxID=2833586 RepID=A0ABS5NWP1_9BACI|nr:TIGR02680 family protein [Cytobacillus citreus]MBS4192249.1 TIGR02680 family protein [Cytobacillus citreus]
MNRAGLVNFWYYDEEVFDFADGKLLLRGSNGSGKSVTMQSFLPVLLDGKKTPDRLDPFGSRARKMEDYLLGEFEVTKRDERTGYLFIEYKKNNTDRYITTGIGLKAKRHKSMDFWGFVIHDGRRIGRDFFLYKEEKVSGGFQKIPLTKKELENTLADGGLVVGTQKEYMELVNKYVFGFESIEAFDDLIKLLIQLRSPKLSKDFKPTVIYGILEESLPELGDEELRSLSDTIENMDQSKHQLEQLERDYESLERLCKQYEQYNQFVLVDKANELIQVEKAIKTREKELEQLENSLTECAEKLTANEQEESELKREQEVFQETKSQLERHEVFNAEEEKQAIEKRYFMMQKELDAKQQTLEQKEKKERELKEAIMRQEEEQFGYEKKIEEEMEELETDAEEAGFNEHRLNAEDFLRHKEASFDFALWKKEAEGYKGQLQQILRLWDEYERLKHRFDDADRHLGEARKKLDSSRRDEEKWLALLDEEKSILLEKILDWMTIYEAFQLNEEGKQLTAQKIHDLFDLFSLEQLIEPFAEIFRKKQEKLLEDLTVLRHKIDALKKDKNEKERDLAYWQEMKEPEPSLHPDTIAARDVLTSEGIGFIPFYKAVEFQDELNEDERAKIESALAEAGILDAIIINEKNKEFIGQNDKILLASEEILDEQQTLLKWLYVDLPDDANVEANQVKKVLQSIAINSSNLSISTTISKDGRFSIGMIHGHAPLIGERAQYIGTQARERHRLMLILEIEKEVARLADEIQLHTQELEITQSSLENMKKGYADFPTAEQVKTANDELKLTKQQVLRDQKEVEEKNAKMKLTYTEWEKVRLVLKEETSVLNIEFSKNAYDEAFLAMNSYMRFLQELQLVFAKYDANRKFLISRRANLEEVIADIDSNKGEMQLLIDKLKLEELKLEQIRKRLEELGADDIRKQIKEVIEQLAAIESRLPELMKESTRLEKDLESLTNELASKKLEKNAYDQLFKDWFALFVEELRFQPDREEHLDNDPLTLAKLVYKENSEVLKKESHVSISDKLAKTFYREQQTLVEYRLSEEVVSYDIPHDSDMNENEEMKLKRKMLMDKAYRTVMLLDYKGQRVTPFYVLKEIANDIEMQKEVLNETDRELYEEIILNSVGRIIRAKIQRAERWVKTINDLMEKRDTSSGLTFSIKWKPKTADAEEEMDTKDLVDLLRSDPRLLKESDMKKVTAHFRSKITRARELSETEGYGTTLHQVIKGILDYRKWFSFTLYYKREGESKKELTNHVFFTFSGGEKAMAMYIPLFSAAYSRYQEARKDAPYIISLDEAFAGVDENNIRDMFELVEELGFNYIMNSQAIWGDYDTVSNLSICELVRPKNAPFVTVIRYYWNGKVRSLKMDEWEEEELKV